MARKRGRHPVVIVAYCGEDFLNGTAALTPWAELAYRRVCDLIYATGDKVEDDDEALRVFTKLGARWVKAKAELIRKEKLFVDGGFLRNPRCSDEIERARVRSQQTREAAEIRHRPGALNGSGEHAGEGA